MMTTMTVRPEIPVILDVDPLSEWMLDHEPAGGWSVDELHTALNRVGRNSAPVLFATLHVNGGLTSEHYVALTGDVWTMAEFPIVQLDGDEWLDLFRRAGYTRTMPDDDDEHGRRWPRPRKPVRLYRGAHHEHRLGWSWTTSLDTARWFADRDLGRGPGQVWTTTVQPSALLARIDGRGESEFVLDGRTVTDADVRALVYREQP